MSTPTQPSLFLTHGAAPCFFMEWEADLDPDTHLRMGQALAPLRDEGVLIVGSGSSFHNLSALGPTGIEAGTAFESWLQQVLPRTGSERDRASIDWDSGPAGRAAHLREEHLIPLMVAAGAAHDEPGRRFFADSSMGPTMSC